MFKKSGSLVKQSLTLTAILTLMGFGFGSPANASYIPGNLGIDTPMLSGLDSESGIDPRLIHVVMNDPDLPAGSLLSDIQILPNVIYALPVPVMMDGDVGPGGVTYVDVYDGYGHFIRRIIKGPGDPGGQGPAVSPIVAVPEPGTVLLFGAALFVLAWQRRLR